MTASPFMKVSGAAAFTLAISWRATGPSMSTPVIEAVSISCLLASITSSVTGVPCVPPLAPSAESLIFRVHIMKIIVFSGIDLSIKCHKAKCLAVYVLMLQVC